MVEIVDVDCLVGLAFPDKLNGLNHRMISIF
jgi:hypothetical protein